QIIRPILAKNNWTITHRSAGGEGCQIELWSFVYHSNPPGVRRTTQSPQSRRSFALVHLHMVSPSLPKCSARMLISRHLAEISADTTPDTVFFRCRDPERRH